MSYQELILLRDETIKNSILALLSARLRAELEPLLEQAFETGSAFWAERQLPVLVGERARASVLDRAIEPEREAPSQPRSNNRSAM